MPCLILVLFEIQSDPYHTYLGCVDFLEGIQVLHYHIHWQICYTEVYNLPWRFQMRFACRNCFNPSIIDVFYVTNDNRGVIDGIDMSSKKTFRDHPSQPLGQVVYIELHVHRGGLVAVLESGEIKVVNLEAVKGRIVR
jgi:hypothetical protein